MAERAQRPVDLRRAHRRVPDLGQHRIVDFLDRRQRPLFRQAQSARVDQPARRQDLVAADEDEVSPVSAPARIADEVGEIADRHRGDQAADEGVVDAPHRRAHVDHRLLDRLAPEERAPESLLRRLELTEALHALRLGDQRDGFPLDRAVGLAERAMQLEIERGEADRRHRRDPVHHDRQHLAHGDGRFDVDTPAGRQRGDQFKLLAHRIEPAAHQRHLGIDHAGRAVDQQSVRGTGRPGQDHDVGDAGNQRERDECKRQSGDERQPPAPAQGRCRCDRRGCLGRAHAADIIGCPPCRSDVALPQAAERMADLLTLSSTWLSNCWKFFSKRWATSRAALS